MGPDLVSNASANKTADPTQKRYLDSALNEIATIRDAITSTPASRPVHTAFSSRCPGFWLA